MKQYFALLFWVIGLYFAVHAQPKGGDFLLSGSFGANQNKSYFKDTSYLSSQTYFIAFFKPQLGIFITKNIAISGFTNIIYNHIIFKQPIENNNGVVETSKTARFVLAWGGAVSYYRTIHENIFWVNKLMYDRGYLSTGVGFSSIIAKNTQTFDKYYFSTYTLQTGIQYFFKPNLSLGIDINALTLISPKKNDINLTVLDKQSFSFGLNFIIQSENE